MKDTDWRPSKCSECGEMREASPAPSCRNVDCGLFGKTIVPKGIEALTPSFKGKSCSRLVQAYKSEDGKTFPSLREAVEHDITQAYEDMVEEWSGDMSRSPKAMASMILQPQYRGRMIRLLKELD